ncbi:Eukaryotic translation initiation factor 1A [Giardia muris]|uniref:Eukaryotic translation initiation factor 1A n=1 Tax=Giardia muris TaxID=5742 RepID=A0A4Z1T3X1_GIAMU|nr:Eukaryotic translation initiation factor 1A [Giardia muris]|eukprot:TNJ27101.1 Eukaryotic translation initiation factor 1A [Giardia muris]
MPGKPKSGGKTHRKKKEGGASQRELVFKSDCEVYGVCLKVLGCGFYMIYTLDGVNRRCHLRGALRKRRVRVSAGDVVLVSLRDFSTETEADIVHNYQPDEVKQLQKYGELPDNTEDIFEQKLVEYGIGAPTAGPRSQDGVEDDDLDSDSKRIDSDDIDNL